MSSPPFGVDEPDVVASTEVRLTENNPDVAPDVIHTLVEQAYARLTPAKVSTFLPILIVREVQADLRIRKTARTDVLELPGQRA